jgi:hypothetical protein
MVAILGVHATDTWRGAKGVCGHGFGHGTAGFAPLASSVNRGRARCGGQRGLALLALAGGRRRPWGGKVEKATVGGWKGEKGGSDRVVPPISVSEWLIGEGGVGWCGSWAGLGRCGLVRAKGVSRVGFG